MAEINDIQQNFQERYDKLYNEMQELKEDIEDQGYMITHDGIIKPNDSATVIFSDWKWFEKWIPERGSLLRRYKVATKVTKKQLEDIEELLRLIGEGLSKEDFNEAWNLDMGGVSLSEILGAELYSGTQSALSELVKKGDIYEFRPYHVTEGWKYGKLEIRNMKIKDLEGFTNVYGQEEIE